MKQLVKTESAQQAIDQAAEAQAVEQFPNQAQDTRQEQTNGGNDLEQRLGQQCPQRVELLLCVRHVGNALLRVVNCLDNV
jgi:hypothetical protein